MDTVRVRFEKWGRRPHWEYDAVRLGSDDHGTWLGLPTGTPIARPGARFVTEQRQVVLVPRGAGFVATRVWVDDEDEFAAHQDLYGYPDHIVDLAVRSCADVRSAVEAHLAPYDEGTAHGWINRLDPTMMQA